MLAAVGEDADVIVVSAVGMDVNSSRADLLPEMLAAVLSGGPLPEGGRAGAIWRLRAAVPPGARGAIARALPDRAALELTSRLELRGIDWAHTAAFAHPADNQGYVRLNLRGRERDGIVAPGEAEALLSEIAAGLQTFCDPDGAPAVACVDRVADHHPGLRTAQLPDLVVRWSARPATKLAGVHSSGFGGVRRRGTGSGRSGNHTPGDAWAVVAPGVSRSRAPPLSRGWPTSPRRSPPPAASRPRSCPESRCSATSVSVLASDTSLRRAATTAPCARATRARCAVPPAATRARGARRSGAAQAPRPSRRRPR